MTISKKDMTARAVKASQMAPSIDDRLRHALELAPTHPAEDKQVSHERTSSEKPKAEPVITASGGRLEVVPLDLIDPNPFNARKIYRLDRVNELAASIGAHGQEIPGVATPRSGRFVMAAGHYRFRALKLLGAKNMALIVYENLSDRDLYAHSYRENAEREAQTTIDNALSWKELLDQGIYSNESEIAEATGQSQPNVNKTLAALRLSSPVLEIVKQDPIAFGLSILYELVLYETVVGQEKTILVTKLVLSGEMGRKEIQVARAQTESLRERKRKETSRQYKIQLNGQQIGSLKEWDSGKVAFEIILADIKERATLIAELRKRFGLTE